MSKDYDNFIKFFDLLNYVGNNFVIIIGDVGVVL